MTPTLDINLQEDIVPYSAFRSSLSAFMDKTRKTQRPILVTQNGKAASVLMDVACFEALRETQAVLADIENAERELKSGQGIPHGQFMSEMAARYRA